MINNYEIKKVNNEEVLYLYFDFNYEFGLINSKNKKQSLNKIIKKYIKDNKIIFKGTTIFLISSGLLIGKVNVNEQEFVDIKDNVVIEEKLDNTKNELVIENNEEIKENVNEIETKINDNSNINTTKQEVKKVDTKKSTTKQNTKTETNQKTNNETKNETKEDNNVKTNNIEPKNNEIEIDNKTYIKVKKSTGEIINIELEEYVLGVVSAEMPASFDTEALKAQAILARTYALKANSKGQVLTTNNSTQNYKTNEELKNMWKSDYDKYYNKIKNAVESTKGYYLSYNGTYIEAVYHSTSNSKTEDASYVWGNSFPYLISVESIYDSSNPSYEKTTFMTYEELSKKLNMDINESTTFDIISYTSSNRINIIKINDKEYKGTSFRNLLGLRSTDIEIIKTEKGINFKTKGYGHGVGMSQYGANGMAKAGYTYKQILSHYYPNTLLKSI